MKQLRAAAKDELGIDLPRSPRDGPVGRLIEAGRIALYPAMEREPGGHGTMRMYRATGLDGMHLGILMELAHAAIDPTLKGKRGRKGHTASARHVERISPAQHDKIRTMARHVSYFLSPTAETEQEAYTAVRGAHLMWDPAEGLDGDWRLFYELIDASRPPVKRRADDRGAAKTLLDLAATHGLLLRQARSESYVIPTAWIPVQEQWTAAARHPGIAAVLAVNYVLGAVAEVLGSEVDPGALTQDEVEQVVQHIQDALLADRSLTTGHKTSIRRSLRRLMDAGLLPRADVNGWDYRQRNRKAAWSATETDAIATTAASEHRGAGLDRMGEELKVGRARTSRRRADLPGYAAWKNFPFPVLADPDHPYSLARCVDFHTAKGRERGRLGFRGLGTYPREPARGTSDLSLIYWSEATVRMRLAGLALYVGWVRRHTEIDLRSASLADLLTPELVEGFVDAVDEGSWTTPDQARRVLVTIGLIASPCLEDEALKMRDTARADQFHQVSCLATGRGKLREEGYYDGSPLHKQLRESAVSRKREHVQQAEAEAVESAYREALGVDWAYDGMVALYAAARERVLKGLGLASMAELRERWETLRVRPTDLEHLRALCIWNLSLAAPLRTRTQRLLTCAMIVDHHGRRLDLAAPAEIFKVESNGPYRAKLWTAGDPGGGFDKELMAAYLMPGGIRHRLLNPRGGRRTSPWLWVNSFARPNTRRAQILGPTMVTACKTVIRLAARGLGLSAPQVKKLLAAGQVHPFRHAVAGRLVYQKRIEDARILLHHRGYGTLHKVYAARNHNVSTSGLRAEIAGSAGDTRLLTLLQGATPEQHAEVLRLLGGDGAG